MNLIINNAILRKADSRLIFCLGILLCVLIAFLKECIFPEKYFFDSLTIQRLIERPYTDLGDKSFTNSAAFYRVLKIDKRVVAPIIAVIFYLTGIIMLFKKYKVQAVTFLNFLLIVAYSAMAMVYLSTYSKDLIVYLFVVIPFIFFEKKYLFIWTIFVLFYAYYIRDYWFITIALFWIIKLFLVKYPKRLLLFVPFYYIVISFVYHYVFGTSLTMIRYMTNLNRDVVTGQTAINVFISGNSFVVEAANFFVTLLFLIVPIPLLILAKPFYIILSLLILVFFYNFIKLYIKEFANKELTNIFSFVISFMLVQSLFEPDYGSYVRHLAPLYPLIFVCIAKNTKIFRKSPMINNLKEAEL